MVFALRVGVDWFPVRAAEPVGGNRYGDPERRQDFPCLRPDQSNGSHAAASGGAASLCSDGVYGCPAFGLRSGLR
jgi:hypothetical protein